MITEHLDNKINELETLRSRGELTYMGGEMLSEFNEIKQALTIPVVVGQSEQLKPMVFELANKLAIAGEGDAAVSMHRIHNRL